MDRVQEVYNGAGLLETLARLFLPREVKPFPPDNKMIKFLPFVYLVLPLRHSRETRRSRMTTATTF